MATGSILKRGKGYLLKYDRPRDLDGKRKITYVMVHGRKSDAEKELRRLLGQVDTGTHVDPTKMSVNEWVEEWLKNYSEPRVAAKTHERYAELFKLHVCPRIGSLPIQKLSPPHIQRLYTQLRKEGHVRRKGGQSVVKGLSEQTIIHVHRVLKNALSEAVRSRVIERNPLADFKAPKKPRKSDGDIHALNQNEVEKILSAFKDTRLYEVVLFALTTGMRRGEIIGLRWTDIDLEKRIVLVQRSVQETKGAVIEFKATKNRSSNRSIGIDPTTVGVLKKLRAKQMEAAFMLGQKLPPDALVFPTSPLEPENPMRGFRVSHLFGDVAERAGFPTLRFHDLRHTHATLLMFEGVPVNAVAQRLGHSTPAITLTVYGHVLKRAEDRAVEVSGQILNSISIES